MAVHEQNSKIYIIKMKQKFLKQWRASKMPGKQRKYRANAPLHIRSKLMSANLSKELRKKHARRTFPLKKGDQVKIMRGEFKGKIGKIDLINLKKLRATIEGINRIKKDGTKIGVFFSPSNLQIKELNLEDRKRIKSLERKSKTKEKEEKPKEKEKQEKKVKEKLDKGKNKKQGEKNASKKK